MQFLFQNCGHKNIQFNYINPIRYLDYYRTLNILKNLLFYFPINYGRILTRPQTGW